MSTPALSAPPADSTPDPTDREALPPARRTRSLRRSVLNWTLVLAVLLLPGFLLPQYPLYVASLTLLYVISATGLNLVLGYAGQISLAQAAMMGIGAYTVALTNGDLPFLVALVLAGMVGFLVGLVIGLPALRVKHHYLAMVTLGFQTIFVLFVLNEEGLTGGSLGVADISRPTLGPLSLEADYAYYMFIAVLCFFVLLGVHWLLNSQWARAFKGIRWNEKRAASVGVDVKTYKLLAFAIGSALAALAGALFAGLLGYVDPTSFTFQLSLLFLLMVLLGGLGRFEGAIIGAVLVGALPELLRVSEDKALIYFAAAGILILLFLPRGLVTVIDFTFERILHRPRPQMTK